MSADWLRYLVINRAPSKGLGLAGGEGGETQQQRDSESNVVTIIKPV